MWRRLDIFHFRGLPVDCRTDRLGEVAALGLLGRDPQLLRVPLPLPTAGLRGCAHGCLGGLVTLHELDRERGGCHAFFRAASLSGTIHLLDECLCAILILLNVSTAAHGLYSLGAPTSLALPYKCCQLAKQNQPMGRRLPIECCTYFDYSRLGSLSWVNEACLFKAFIMRVSTSKGRLVFVGTRRGDLSRKQAGYMWAGWKRMVTAPIVSMKRF